jgi:hypothetical protein
MQKSREYTETHDNKPYMRRVFIFQLKQGERAAREFAVKAQEAAEQL